MPLKGSDFSRRADVVNSDEKLLAAQRNAVVISCITFRLSLFAIRARGFQNVLQLPCQRVSNVPYVIILPAVRRCQALLYVVAVHSLHTE
jgi:hypothetical protein